MKQVHHPTLAELTLTGILAALSDPTRLAIVRTLSDGKERGWAEFKVGVGKSTLSHHMRALREAGVTHTRQEGTRCFVSIRIDIERRFPGLIAGILTFSNTSEPSRHVGMPDPQDRDPDCSDQT